MYRRMFTGTRLAAMLLTLVATIAPHFVAAAKHQPKTLSLSEFLNSAARELFPKDSVDIYESSFRDFMLYLFDRYPPTAADGKGAQQLPAMLRENRIGGGAALDYWLERTLGKARDHAYKHIEKSYWAEQQKIEYNMLGREFRNIERAVHGMANLRFEPEHVKFFTDFVREYMKKPASKTATVNDFVREFKNYVKSFDTAHQNGGIIGDIDNNSTKDFRTFRSFRSLGPFNILFGLASKVTDAFNGIQKMMGPVRGIVAFIPGIGCTLNALSVVSCFFNENTGIAALLNGHIGIFDLARCGLNIFGSIARGIDGIKLSKDMLIEFFKGILGGGVGKGISNAYNVVAESNFSNDPWADIGVENWIPGHDAFSDPKPTPKPVDGKKPDAAVGTGSASSGSITGALNWGDGSQEVSTNISYNGTSHHDKNDGSSSISYGSGRDALQCSAVPQIDQIDCAPGVSPQTQAVCEARGCCWNATAVINSSKVVSTSTAPPKLVFGPAACYYGMSFNGLRLTGQHSATNATVFDLTLGSDGAQPPYPNTFQRPQVEVYYETSTRLRVKIHAPNSSKGPQWMPPTPKRFPINQPAENNQLLFETSNAVNDNTPFTFKIVRNTTSPIKNCGEAADCKSLFDTNVQAPLIVTDQFMEFHTKLSVPVVYGIGEHFAPLNRYGNWSHYSMWTFDNLANDDQLSFYGMQPFYMSLDCAGRAYGVLLFNSNAQEILMRPGNQLTWRTIGGIIDLYFFAGPTPDDVVRQLTDLLGKPHIPPYWSFGYQVSRWGYAGTDGMREIIQRNVEIGVPIDVISNGHDSMNNSLDFTLGETFRNMNEFVQELHSQGRRWVPLIDPQISTTEPRGSYPPYDQGIEMNVFVKDKNGSIFAGEFWTNTTEYWVDFTSPNGTQYWTDMFQQYRDKYTLFDGAWIDVNEPSNFVNGSANGVGCYANDTLDNPPYLPALHGLNLFTHSLCPSARHGMSSHYDVHNMYAHTQAISTRTAMLQVLKPNDPTKQLRPFVLTRSNFLGTGHYAAGWSGDYFSTWLAMRRSIAYIINFSMFGMPMVGADICGFQLNTTEELCTRWHQLATFYPLARNNNNVGNKDKDPAAWPEPARSTMRAALQTRYALMPYMYTLRMVDAHVNGSAVTRGLVYNFPKDANVYSIDDQFMLGNALLVNPITAPNVTHRWVYLPQGRWYDYLSGRELLTSIWGVNITMDVPLDAMSVLQMGGSIIPHQYDNLTLTASRLNPFYLQVALCDNMANPQASGKLIWDDGLTHGTYAIAGETNGTRAYSQIDFHANTTSVTSSIRRVGYKPEQDSLPPMKLDKINVLGVYSDCTNFKVLANGAVVPTVSVKYDKKTGKLSLEQLNLMLLDGKGFAVNWSC